MKKKDRNLQLVLLTIGLALFVLTYFYYPNTKKDEFLENERMVQDKKNENSETTFFENLEYQGMYDLDKPFKVTSKKAHILAEEPDIVYMNNMFVILYLRDNRKVEITSLQGRYNKSTYDCFFEKEVVATDGEIIIKAENLDLLATENFVKIYNKVKLNHPTGNLRADKIDYDFETKNFKVSMFDKKSVKIKVIQ